LFRDSFNLRGPYPDMKSLLSGILLILVVPLLLFTSACRFIHDGKTPPKAVKGILDLTHWDFEKDGPVDLHGEYEFHWEQHLQPSDFSNPSDQTQSFINVPGFWSKQRLEGRKLPGQGYATYRLRVLLNGAQQSLALRFQDMGTAYRVYVNGKVLDSVGVPGKDRESTVPRYFPQVLGINESADRLDILFHVSNFHHRRGGAWEPIQLGQEGQLRGLRERRVGIDLFLFGSIFVMALYHFGLFFLRKEDRSPLYFGLFCFVVAVRLLTTGERYLTHIFPDISWGLLVKLEYLSMCLAVPSFALFMQSLFSNEFSRLFLRFIGAASVSVSLVVLFTPGRVFSHLLPVCQGLILLTFLYGLYVLVLALKHKRAGVSIFLAGFVIMSLATINDIIHVEMMIQTGYLAAFGFFVFIFSQASLLSLRFSRALATVEVQHKELIAVNETCRQEIKDRVLTEDALRQSEEKYRVILQSIEDGYYEVDLAGNFTFFNDALCRILGYPKDEMMGMNNRAFMSEATAKRVYETFNQVYHTGQPAKALGWETIRKDRTRRYLETSVSLVRDEKGTPIGFRGLARDVTDRKDAEDRERVHHQQLLQASKMVELGTLVSGVAHEINNPNNFIMLNAPLLMDSWKAAKSILEEYYKENGDFLLGGMMYSEMRENIPKLFSGILEGSERIKQIVADLKDYVRPDTSDLSQSVNLNSVIQSALSLLSNMVKKSTDRFSVDLEKNLPLVKGNFQRLEQVVINIVQNACQALPDRKKGIRVSTRWDEANGKVILQVQDEGVGIPPETLPRIMDPFFSTRHDSGGVGLGLAISSRIIKEQGGTINFASELGIGTKAEVFLPVVNRITKPGKEVTQ
jgi:PAS domain S-box-containing protein